MKNQKTAALKSMEDFESPATAAQIGENAKKYFLGEQTRDWSVILSDTFKSGDVRIKRIKDEKGKYAYYLTSKEAQMKFPVDDIARKTYSERDLHKLFVSYLKNESICAKTIFHETSNGKEKNQIWTHPDIVGVKFLKLETAASNFIKTTNVINAFDIYSYELKTEIKNDTDLKQWYFQAVSNSTWANYGYLVAVEIESNLLDELKRLSQSFGIGFIKLSAKNPFSSKIVWPAQKKNLDFNTISKLCKQNPGFEKFINDIRDIVSEVSETKHNSILSNFEQNCDEYFKTNEDESIEKYCLEKKIPIDDEEE